MATVVLVGTLDTKGHEYGFLRDRLREQGVEVVLVDAGILEGPRIEPDVSREEVARAAGADVEELARAGDRGAAVAAMARGAGEVVKRLHSEGRLHGVLGLGGSGGSALVTHAMRELPVGVPKLMVSTVASGDTRPYVGEVDIAMLDESVERVQAMHDAAKAANPDVLVLCHGGPIASPGDAEYVLDRTEGVVGFFGASSMERLPTEVAMTENMKKFKSIGAGG